MLSNKGNLKYVNSDITHYIELSKKEVNSLNSSLNKALLNIESLPTDCKHETNRHCL
jgi:hypothetical protein